MSCLGIKRTEERPCTAPSEGVFFYTEDFLLILIRQLSVEGRIGWLWFHPSILLSDLDKSQPLPVLSDVRSWKEIIVSGFQQQKPFKNDSEILQQNPLNKSKTVEDFLGQVQGWAALTPLLMCPWNSREQFENHEDCFFFFPVFFQFGKCHIQDTYEWLYVLTKITRKVTSPERPWSLLFIEAKREAIMETSYGLGLTWVVVVDWMRLSSIVSNVWLLGLQLVALFGSV